MCFHQRRHLYSDYWISCADQESSWASIPQRNLSNRHLITVACKRRPSLAYPTFQAIVLIQDFAPA